MDLTVNKVLIVLIAFNLIACKTDETYTENDYALEYSLKYYNEKNLNRWQNEFMLTQKVDDALFTGDTYFGGYYSYKKTIIDTISILYFEFYCNENDTIFIPKHYYQRFIKDSWQHILSFDKGGDTLYHYKAELFGRMKKFFISGEYSYRYEFGEMNYDERMFFEQHKDSVKRIRGMNLPPLLILPE